jgi:hypothetical protein
MGFLQNNWAMGVLTVWNGLWDKQSQFRETFGWKTETQSGNEDTHTDTYCTKN